MKKRSTDIGNMSSGSRSARENNKSDGYSLVNIVFNYFNEPEAENDNNEQIK